MGKRAGSVAAVVLVIVLSGCGGDSDPVVGAGGTGPEEDTVVLKDIAFTPEELEVEAGTTVTWRFEDKGIPHDVKAEDESFASDIMESGTFQHTFDQPGTYPYLCSVHPTQMKATIVVR